MASTVWKTLMRRKIIQQPEESNLGRVLSTWDLTFLGVGATLGIGLYVLVGKVARETAGPSIVLSFLIAAIASGFAGLCYAEFGARVPRAGSAYIYSYVCIGELVAFIIGWNLILEYVIGSASVAHGMSLYIDSITNDSLKNHFTDIAPVHVSFFSHYFDFFAFALPIILSIGLAIGVKESSYLNNFVTLLNMAVVIFVFIAGGMKADSINWKLAPGDASTIGNGGFFPFGYTGMIKGAATCFYGFVGFDCIATTGEEAKNPRKSIPIAILFSLVISLVAYCGTAAVVTLMVPYYLQDIDSPIPSAFDAYDMDAAKWIVTIGGLFALSASLFGAMFPLPRIIYAMASDGLIFRFLGKVNERFATPLIGTLLAGILTGIMGGLFEQSHLIDMMSIGTLMAYTIVAACVLVLRYSIDVRKINSIDTQNDDYDENKSEEHRESLGWISVAINRKRFKKPTEQSQLFVCVQVVIFGFLAILAGLCAIFLPDDISNGEVYAIVLPSIVATCMLIVLISICLQPQSNTHLSFKVPLVPLIPCLSILVNIYLMMALDAATWIRFGIWMLIGLPIYWCSKRPYCGGKPEELPIGCGKPRNLSEGSTYINYGDINGMEGIVLERRTVEIPRRQQKEGTDSDSGAYFEENEHEDTEQSIPEAELSQEEMGRHIIKNNAVVNILEPPEMETASIQDALGTLDNILEKEEEKCSDSVPLSTAAMFRNRSVSIVSSVSNNSYNLPMEVNVVAIVHHEDEREPIIEEVENPEESDDSEMYTVLDDKRKEGDVFGSSGLNVAEARNTVLLPSGLNTFGDAEDHPSPETPTLDKPSTPVSTAVPLKRKAPPPPTITPLTYTPSSTPPLKEPISIPPPPPPKKEESSPFSASIESYPLPQDNESSSLPAVEESFPPPPPPSMLDFEQFKTDPSFATLRKEDIGMELPSPPLPPPPPSMSEFEQYKMDPTPSFKVIDTPLPPPPPPLNSKTKFTPETNPNVVIWKDVDFSSARATLKKAVRPISPPLSKNTTPISTPTQSRRLTSSKSEMDLYTPPEDNIKLSSHDVKTFKDKLAANLGNMPKNLKFSVTPAPNFNSLDRHPLNKKPTDSSSSIPHQVLRKDSLSVSNSDVRRKNSGVLGESLKNVNMAAIKERLTQLYTNRSEDQGVVYRNRKKTDAQKDKNEFGETIA